MTNLSSTLKSVGATLLLVVGSTLVGCAAPAGDAEEPAAIETQSAALEASCTPAVIVIRHAEDADADIGEKCVVGEADLAIPGGTQKIHQSCLTPAGKAHAKLYAEHLAAWMASKNFCPVGKIVTQDPWTNTSKGWPSANPFETIRDFANATGAPISFMAPSTEFKTDVRASLLGDAGHSTVVSWDKEGLAEGSAPMLSKMTTATASFPTRDMIYAFTNMNAATAKFDLAESKQFFQDSSGYFAKVTGSAFIPSSYYRFDDGALKSKTANSPDLVPSAMLICGGSSCGGQGVTLSASKRK